MTRFCIVFLKEQTNRKKERKRKKSFLLSLHNEMSNNNKNKSVKTLALTANKREN